MTKRKTLNVSLILAEANKQLARKDDFATADFKAGICVMIERILMDTGNYEGYNYNLWIFGGGSEQWFADGKPEKEDKYLYSEFGGKYDRFYY